MIKEFFSDNRPHFFANDVFEKETNMEYTYDCNPITKGVLVLNERGKVISLNSTLCSLVGLDSADFLGMDIGLVPNMGNVPAIVHKEILIKKRSANFIGIFDNREVMIFGTYHSEHQGKAIKIVLVLIELNKLRDLVLNREPAEELHIEGDDLEYNGLDEACHEGIIATDAAMKRVLTVARRVAQVDSTILITGETGVGKEVIANFVHRHSKRSHGPFVKINCNAIPENLIESELFGYEAGAFTGAKRDGKAGLIEMANGGTLFLDEIGDLPLAMQVKMLRVLQEREIQRVGGITMKKVDFRLIAATNRNLEDMVKNRLFREDLFYRLNVVPVKIPPLRERKEEIMPLTSLFLDKFNRKYGLDKKISAEIIRNFLSYEWPGNVRELENTIERLVVTSDANIILMENLAAGTNIGRPSGNDSGLSLRNSVDETERHLLLQAAQQCKNTREMAAFLGISQSAVVKKMRKHGINKVS